ncbi:MAG: tetratricopeptide repeat protein [Hyphomicrobiaceae bacterium]
MQIDAYWTELQGLLAGLIVHVPGETLNDKTGLLANIFGIAGFILSVGIVVARLVMQRGKRRPATLADLDRLGASIAGSFRDRIVDQLATGELTRLADASWLAPNQRLAAQDQLKRGLAVAVQAIASDHTETGRSAASALIKGDLDAAEDYFEAKSKSAETDGSSSYEAAEALHLKAALQSLRDQAGAIVACLRAVDRNPADPLGWSRLGHLYLRTGQLTEAQAAFQRAVAE